MGKGQRKIIFCKHRRPAYVQGKSEVENAALCSHTQPGAAPKVPISAHHDVCRAPVRPFDVFVIVTHWAPQSMLWAATCGNKWQNP